MVYYYEIPGTEYMLPIHHFNRNFAW